jgi:hypothetical protein
MVGRIQNSRPGCSSLDARDWINDRIRQSLGARTYWTDLITQKVMGVPAMYNTGTVSLATASRVVTGTTTAWPVNDVVNTTIPAAINDIGYVEVVPASMSGITEDSILYVDAAGTPEAVSVVEKKRASIIAKFENTHAAGVTVTQSSLAGLQFRIAVSDPVFTVRNVISTTSLELSELWMGAAKTDEAYRILKMYLTIATDLKDILSVKDESTGWPVRLHVPVHEVNHRDPRRTFANTGALLHLVDLGPNDQGNMQYEMWPAPTTLRQFSVLYYRQWPDLVNEMDRPPWFINPTIFVHGAIADALRWKRDAKDPYHNPALAEEYERRFVMGLQNSINEDESKWQHAYSYRFQTMFYPAGADYRQSHDPNVNSWDFGSGAW